MSKIERESRNDAKISIIAAGMTIVGDCETDGTVRVEGRVEGTIRAGKSVVVGRDGEVVGDIITQDAVISGAVSGNLTADSRLELQSTAQIQGEIRSRRVQLDEGAQFNGQFHMADSRESARADAGDKTQAERARSESTTDEKKAASESTAGD